MNTQDVLESWEKWAYPNAYHVRTNYCRCHPETCCCNDWAVHAPNGEKHSTHFHKETADLVAEALNAKRSNAKITGSPG